MEYIIVSIIFRVVDRQGSRYDFSPVTSTYLQVLSLAVGAFLVNFFRAQNREPHFLRYYELLDENKSSEARKFFIPKICKLADFHIKPSRW